MEKCGLVGCAEVPAGNSAYCSDQHYADDIWRVVKRFSRLARAGLWRPTPRGRRLNGCSR